MNDLFPIEAKPEAFYSTKLRFVAVQGDSMNPTLMGGRDFALIHPINRYVGEGIYLINTPLGEDFWRVASTLDQSKRLKTWRDNDRYGERLVTREFFEENVLAIVVADVKVRDSRMLREATQ